MLSEMMWKVIVGELHKSLSHGRKLSGSQLWSGLEGEWVQPGLLFTTIMEYWVWPIMHAKATWI